MEVVVLPLHWESEGWTTWYTRSGDADRARPRSCLRRAHRRIRHAGLCRPSHRGLCGSPRWHRVCRAGAGGRGRNGRAARGRRPPAEHSRRERDVPGRREKLAAIGRARCTASVSVVVDRDPAAVIHETVKRLGCVIACLANHGRGRSVTLRTSVASDVIARGGDPSWWPAPGSADPKGSGGGTPRSRCRSFAVVVWSPDGSIGLAQPSHRAGRVRDGRLVSSGEGGRLRPAASVRAAAEPVRVVGADDDQGCRGFLR